MCPVEYPGMTDNSSVSMFVMKIRVTPILNAFTVCINVSGEALIEFLRFLNDSNHLINDWNDHFVSPCFSWSHVTCRDGNVVSL